MENMDEFEVKYATDMPAGSSGIVTSFPAWLKEPEPLTKEDMDMVIKIFRENPVMFKKDRPRW